MNQAAGAIKWAIYMIAMLVVGPLAAAPLAALRDASGGHEATVLVSTSLVWGVVAGLIPLAAAAAVGLLSARFIGPRHGMIAAGLVLAWAAWRSASIDGLMRATRDGSAVVPLAIEGAVLGVLGVLIGTLIWAVGREPGRQDHATATPGSATTPNANPFQSALRLLSETAGGGGAALASLAAGVVAGGMVAWLIAQEPLKGQTIAAALLAGIAAGGFGRAVAPRAEAPPSPVPALLAMALLATLGPLSALLMTGAGPRLVGAAIQGSIFPLAMPMPLDWLAGAFWGIPIGLSWADSMVDKPAK